MRFLASASQNLIRLLVGIAETFMHPLAEKGGKLGYCCQMRYDCSRNAVATHVSEKRRHPGFPKKATRNNRGAVGSPRRALLAKQGHRRLVDPKRRIPPRRLCGSGRSPGILRRARGRTNRDTISVGGDSAAWRQDRHGVCRRNGPGRRDRAQQYVRD